MRLLIVSDTWEPRVSGVVTCLRALVAELEALGHEVHVLWDVVLGTDRRSLVQ